MKPSADISKTGDPEHSSLADALKHWMINLLLIGVLTSAGYSQPKASSMTSQHARGTFTVDIKPLTPPPAEGLGRFSIDKQLTGDLQGFTKGEMFSGGDPRKGIAGYVAIEVFTGTLAGKHGSFALQHSATMDQNGNKMTVIVVPGSGAGDLQGISGTFTIDIANGHHSYDLAYTLPE